MLGNIRIFSATLLRNPELLNGKGWLSVTVKHINGGQRRNHSYDLRLANLPLSFHHVDNSLFQMDRNGAQFRILVPDIKEGVRNLKEIEYEKFFVKAYSEAEAAAVVITKQGTIGLVRLTTWASSSRRQILAQLKALSEFWATSIQTGVINFSNKVVVIISDKESLLYRIRSRTLSTVRGLNEGRLFVFLLPMKIKEQSRALFHASSQHTQTSRELAMKGFDLVNEWYMRRTPILKNLNQKLFEFMPKFMKNKKDQKSEPTCQPVRSPGTLTQNKQPDVQESINKKWLTIKEKLPSWQTSIANHLEKIQDFVNKRLPK